jgi:hypothetical protein
VEGGEPVRADNPGGQSVWYRWRAPCAGQAVFDITGSRFDAMLYTYVLLTVYAGASLTELVPAADNYDPLSSGYLNRVSFAAQAGQDYSISVDGFYDPVFCRCVASGTISLSWTQPGVLLLSAPRFAPGQAVEMDLVAPKGVRCNILSSANLTHWELHTNFLTSAFTTKVTADAAPARHASGFFRAVLVE